MARLYGILDVLIMSLYKNTYRVESTRLQHHDYTFAGLYFITICTKDKKYSFGEISDGKMNLSATGKIAEQCWSEIPKHFPSAAIDAFVVMPNHIHGIIILSATENAYKSSVTRISRKSGIMDFSWQERFYDHVIRGEHTFHKVRRYINDNVALWKQDELNLQSTP